MELRESLQKRLRCAALICLFIIFYTPSSARTETPVSLQTEEELLGPLDHLGGAATEIGLLESNFAAVAINLDLFLFDLKNPSNPIQVSKLSFPVPITDLFTFADYAYLLVGAQVYIIDLTDPHRPIRKGILSTSVYDMDGEQDFLFLANGEVDIYSLSDPASPELVEEYTSDETGECGEAHIGHYQSVNVVSSFPYLYVHSREPCWDGAWNTDESDYILDISELGDLDEISNRQFSVQDVETAQDYAFFVPHWSLVLPIQVVARQDRDNLKVSATISSPGVQDIAVNGNYLYVLDDTLGLRIFDITNPLSAKVLSVVPSLAGVRELVVAGPLAYIAAGSQGLVVVDVQNPASPAQVGNHHTVGIAYEATATGNYAYVSSDRLDIVDISNPAHLSAVGEYPRIGSTSIAGDVLYMASGVDGLVAIDISNPLSLVELDVIDTPGKANAVAVDGSYAYVADGSGGLRVVDVSNPSELYEVGSLSSPNPLLDVAVSNGYVYLIGEQFLVVDVSDPSSPVTVFTYEDHDLQYVVVYGEYVFVTRNTPDCGCARQYCSGEAGLIAFKKSSPSDWDTLSERELYCPIGDLEIAGDKLYVTSPPYYAGILDIIVFDAADPTNEEPISAFNGSAWGLAVLDKTVIVADQERGIYSLKWWSPRKYFLPIVK